MGFRIKTSLEALGYDIWIEIDVIYLKIDIIPFFLRYRYVFDYKEKLWLSSGFAFIIRHIQFSDLFRDAISGFQR